MFQFFKKFFKKEPCAECATKSSIIDEYFYTVVKLEKRLKDPKSYLEAIVPGEVEWYDYQQLDKANMEEYKRFAQTILQNPVFKNEIGFLINNYAKKSLSEVEDYGQVRDLRMQCLALKALEQRISEIPSPDEKEESVRDPYSAI